MTTCSWCRSGRAKAKARGGARASQSQGQSQGPEPGARSVLWPSRLLSRSELASTASGDESAVLPHGDLSTPFRCAPLTLPEVAFSDQFRAKLKVQPAFAEFGPPDVQGSANMFNFSQSDPFGHKGDIFIAQTGSLPPGTGATVLTGYESIPY